jgi:hypothetical protein
MEHPSTIWSMFDPMVHEAMVTRVLIEEGYYDNSHVLAHITMVKAENSHNVTNQFIDN